MAGDRIADEIKANWIAEEIKAHYEALRKHYESGAELRAAPDRKDEMLSEDREKQLLNEIAILEAAED